MNNFIVLKDGVVTLSNSRESRAVVGELSDILLAVENETGENIVCMFVDTVVALLDSEYLSGVDVSLATVEYVYNEINRND